MFPINCHNFGIRFSLMARYLYHSNCLDHPVGIYCTYVVITADFIASSVCGMNDAGQTVFLFNKKNHNWSIFSVVFLQ